MCMYVYLLITRFHSEYLDVIHSCEIYSYNTIVISYIISNNIPRLLLSIDRLQSLQYEIIIYISTHFI